jgi:hypothetical protein
MSETVSLEWIGTQLRVIQAEQRTIRAENEILRSTILNALDAVVRVLNDRIGNFEALTEARLDQLRLEMSENNAQLRLEMSENNAQLRLEMSENTTRIIAAIDAGGSGGAS